MTQTAQSAKSTTRPRMSYEEFLREYDGESAEWVDGEARPMSPVSSEHDDIGGFVYAIMREFVSSRKLGRALHDKFQMKTGPRLPGREPDVMFVSNERLPSLHDTWLEGPADLVVEVISADSVQRDRIDKFGEYERGGVREYWLIDPVARSAEFYLLGAEGRYNPAAAGPDGVYRSTVLPGFWIRLEWLWSQPPPGVVAVMREWGLA